MSERQTRELSGSALDMTSKKMTGATKVFTVEDWATVHPHNVSEMRVLDRTTWGELYAVSWRRREMMFGEVRVDAQYIFDCMVGLPIPDDEHVVLREAKAKVSSTDSPSWNALIVEYSDSVFVVAGMQLGDDCPTWADRDLLLAHSPMSGPPQQVLWFDEDGCGPYEDILVSVGEDTHHVLWPTVHMRIAGLGGTMLHATVAENIGRQLIAAARRARTAASQKECA